MKRLLLLCLLLPLCAQAQSYLSGVGLYAQPYPGIPYVDVVPGPPCTAYLLAIVDEQDFPNGITGARFRVSNLPPDGYIEGGLILETWTSEEVAGDLHHDFSIDWPLPQVGYIVLIAELEFFCFNPDWVGVDRYMRVEPGEVFGSLVLLDSEHAPVTVIGDEFWINCSDPAVCNFCYFCPDPAQESSWTDVKGLY